MSKILDIETCAKTEAELAPLMPEFDAPATWKDPEKIKANIEEKKVKWMEDAALHADRSRVLVAGIYDTTTQKTSILEGDEKDIINVIWLSFNESAHNFVGHNIKGFDIPFLARRSWMLGISTPGDLMRGRYISDRFIDTMERWACGTKDTISLDNLSKCFGLPGKNGNGKDFAGQYLLGGKFRDKAIEYLKNDLLMTYAVAQKMGVV
jgi:predicted PolB exonuclease-like 3'-5' exonuclease